MILRRGSTGDQVRALQVRLTDLGYPCGVPDGDFGPKTEAAVRAWETATHVLGIIDDTEWDQIQDVFVPRPNAPARTAPPYDDLTRLYGKPWIDPHAFERRWIGNMRLPPELCRLTRRGSIRCHVDIMAPLTLAFHDIIEQGASAAIHTFDGSFNIRPIRGSTARPPRYSVHSWGFAVDINAAENPLGTSSTQDPYVIAAFENTGWRWGGKFRRQDGMHFEFTSV